MDLRMQTRSLMLMYRFFLRGDTRAHQIPYQPQKAAISPSSLSLPRPIAPERVGIASAHVVDFLNALEADRETHLHTVALSRGGQLFAAAAAPGYDLNTRHLTHSLCKSLVGMAVGIAVGEGLLGIDTPICRILTDGLPSLSSRMKAITSRHLLTMSSGVAFAEAGSITEENWIRAFFESSVTFPPGSAFAYNSMNTYMLAAVVERVAGCDFLDYIASRLLTPLGITDVLWERCPRGHIKGGWGLYLSPAEMLRIGELILNGGLFHGRRLVPREWMEEMCRAQIETPQAHGDYRYGYQIWIGRDGRSLLCSGMLGQNIWICPENGVVLVNNAGNGELYQRGEMFEIFRRFFCRAFPADRRKNARAHAALREKEAAFFRKRAFTKPLPPPPRRWLRRPPTPLPEEVAALNGRRFLLPKNAQGLLPTFVALMQNSLHEGLRSLTLLTDGHTLTLRVKEGEVTYRLPIGFSDFAETRLKLREEVYLVRARGQFQETPDGRPLLKLELIFPELPCTRRIKLYYTDEPRLEYSERPGRSLIESFVYNMPFTVPKGEFLAPFVRLGIDRGVIAKRVNTCFDATFPLEEEPLP